MANETITEACYRMAGANDVSHEIDNDLPAYLVFLILGHIKNLRRIEPNHILVKAVEDALKKQPPDPAPQQDSFGF